LFIVTTQPTSQKKIFVGVGVIKKTTTKNTGTDYNLGSSRQPWKMIFSLQPYLNPKRQNMGDNLNIFEMGDNLTFYQMEDNLNF
jgi:hypothetical protein